VRDRLYVSCHCTLSDDLSLARVHDVQTELEIRFKQAAPELFRVLIHPEPSTDNRRQDQSRDIFMTEASATWIEKQRFNGIASSGHSIVVDGDKATANTPMELVLIGLCGCTGYDVVSILQKKREPFTSVEVRAEAERAANPPQVYTAIKLIYRIGGKVSHKAAEDAVRLSKEKYCSVSAMLEKTAKITTQIEYVGA